MRSIFILCLLLSGIFCSGQTCPTNVDFEAGDFSNWQCFTGSTYVSSGSNVMDLNPSAPTTGRHEIITSASLPLLDPFGNFPRHCPYSGSGFSVKLGNENSGAEAEGLAYTFQIPPSADTFSVTYFYAVVFENPGHPPSQQPRFFVTAYDVLTGNLIDCASYNYVSTASIPGFQQSLNDPSILYKDWTPASIDFSGLAGRQVRLEFKTADCTQSAHFGYAYVDVSTGCGGLITVAALCGSSNTVVLNAPYGFQNYTWYNSNYSGVMGNQQNVTLSPPPPANSLFHVDMVPYPGFGCRDTADAMVTALPVPDTPLARSNYDFCQFDMPQQLTATPSSPNAMLWYTSATGGTGSSQAPIPSTSVPGTFRYYVTQKVLFGCESERKEIVVNVIPTPNTSFTVNNIRQCQGTNNFIFSSTVSNTLSNAIYQWDFGDGNTSDEPDPAHTYSSYGPFTVKLNVKNPPSCSREFIGQVNVIAEPVANFSFPQVICEQQTLVALVDNSTVPGGSGTVSQWQWMISDAGSTAQHPPPFLMNGGNLPVKLVVRTSEGCSSAEKSVILPVHYRPVAKLAFNGALCNNEVMTFTDRSTLPSAASPDRVAAWTWLVDNVFSVTQQNPQLILASGIHHVNLVAETNLGCKSIAIDTSLVIYGKPNVGVTINDSCINRSIRYDGTSNNSNSIVNWYWSFNNGRIQQSSQSIIKRYTSEQNNPIKLIGETIRGCKDTIIRPFRIYENHAFAGRDTVAAIDQPVQLNAGGSDMLFYSWSPSLGLNNAGIRNPVATLHDDQLYELNSMSIYGCDAYSKILIRRYKGPELFVPSAFTPNGDGLNDVLRVFPVGISKFHSFAVYNRFGVRLFYTADHSRGWDGTYRGAKSEPGTYVFMVSAVDYHGKEILKKGTAILIK